MEKKLRVLVACEYSGVVRDSFIRYGHDAMSCDLLPTDAPGPHYEGDVRDVLNDGWDLMIAHPECTYLTNSGVRWLSEKDKNGNLTDRAIRRWDLLNKGAEFFRRMLEAPIPSIAVENPIMHRYAVERVGRKQDQIIQPWMFGHTQTKATGLWLKNLPLLKPTNNVREEMMKLPVAERSMIHYAPPGPDRWKFRSTTFTGIGDAMAQQWGGKV